MEKVIKSGPPLNIYELGEGEFFGYAATWSLDQVGDIIHRDAFYNLDEFLAEGAILWGHDATGLPVAMVLDYEKDDTGLLIHARFHSTPEAQSVYQVIKERLENGKRVSLSVGFLLEEAQTVEAGGGTARLITRARLIEVSLVNFPANKQAQVVGVKSPDPGYVTDASGIIVVAQDAVITPFPRHAVGFIWSVERKDVIEHYMYKLEELRDTYLLKAEEDWVLGGARDLDLLDDESWDGDAAEAALRRLAGGDPKSEDFDWELYRKGFVVYNRAEPKLLRSYKLPFAKVRDGKLVASRRGLIAVRAAVRGARGGVDLPRDLLKRVEEFVDSYLEREEEQ